MDFAALMRLEKAALMTAAARQSSGEHTQAAQSPATPVPGEQGRGHSSAAEAEGPAVILNLGSRACPCWTPTPSSTSTSTSTGVAPPPLCRLITDCMSEGDESALLSHIRTSPDAVPRWVELSGRRLQQYGGRPTRLGLESPEPLPPWLSRLCEQLEGAVDSEGRPLFEPLGLEGEGGGGGGGSYYPRPLRPNHALINEYAPDEFILPHTDGPIYAPVVATLSLGSPALMVYEEGFSAWELRKQTGGVARGRLELELPRRSCVVTSGALYSDWLHSIPPGTVEGEDGGEEEEEREEEKEEEVAGAGRSGRATGEAGGAAAGEEVKRGRRSGEGKSPGLVVHRTGPRVSITLRYVPPLRM